MPSEKKAFLAALLLSFSFVLGCTWETDLPDDITSIRIERDRELVIVDDAVLAPLSRNDESGPLSFRHATESLPLGEGATLRWLEAWSSRLEEDGDEGRASLLHAGVTCPWLRQSAANGCNADCSKCEKRMLPLDRAPFRLIAVSNRTDLAVMPDRAAGAGEGRLVFAVTAGPGNDATSTALPFAVIYEYAQEGSALEWAKKWHALGEPTGDFGARLVALTESFVGRGALAQIRTADDFTGPMRLHQFEVASGTIVKANVRNSPDWSHVSEADLRAFVDANASAMADGTAVMPRAWWARSSSPSDVPPAFVSEEVKRQSCGGCHERSWRAFHINPQAKGSEKLSRFMVEEELPRRERAMQLLLSGRVTL